MTELNCHNFSVNFSAKKKSYKKSFCSILHLITMKLIVPEHRIKNAGLLSYIHIKCTSRRLQSIVSR